MTNLRLCKGLAVFLPHDVIEIEEADDAGHGQAEEHHMITGVFNNDAHEQRSQKHTHIRNGIERRLEFLGRRHEKVLDLCPRRQFRRYNLSGYLAKIAFQNCH